MTIVKIREIISVLIDFEHIFVFFFFSISDLLERKRFYRVEYINNYMKKPSCKNKIIRRRWEFSAFTAYFDTSPKSRAHFGSRTNINIYRSLYADRVVFFLRFIIACTHGRKWNSGYVY